MGRGRCRVRRGFTRSNTRSAPEEATAIARLCEQMLASELSEDGGTRRRRITWDDIVVVAPYNAQVRAIAAALGPSARVGTVDRFQGQEAPIVIVSLVHSDFEEDTAAGAAAGGGAKGISFVLNMNRMNVALSRAQCLAVVVASPRLVDVLPRSLQQQKELAFLCRVREAARDAGLMAADSPRHPSLADRAPAAQPVRRVNGTQDVKSRILQMRSRSMAEIPF